MSVLTNKRILIVGDESTQITLLKNELESRGVIVSELMCSEVDTLMIDDAKIDLIIFNHTHRGEMCSNVQKVLTGSDTAPLVPVFTLVNDTSEDIQEALAEGAADYITSVESTDSILQKIEAVLGEGDIFSSSSSIDITPIRANVKTTGIRVFVVEDDPLLRNLLSIRLEKSSFPFEFSSDGKDIIPAMMQFKPDILILDLMLPGKSGFEILAELKANELVKNVPVIVFSNRDGAEDRSRAKELGASSFYVKAMTDLSELIETIESQVKK